MSIEQKIADILAESKQDEVEIEETAVETEDEVVAESVDDTEEDTVEEEVEEAADEDDADDDTAEDVVEEEAETEDEMIIDVKDDVDALVNGEDLSEEFKTKAATIFEAAIVSRVKSEVAKLQEGFDAKLEEAKAENKEALVEKVDGYLNYVVEQWIKNNELALEHGIKSEILEGFVSGLKGLFEEHYIDIPEEKFDVLGSMEQENEDLKAKLDEQVAANVELTQTINDAKRSDILKDASETMTETEKEKFFGLAEELSFEDEETFTKKVQTIRENYFTGKSSTNVESVVSDSPVEDLTEETKKPVDPKMAKYLNALKQIS
jgi:hypothetical protein